MCSGRVEVFHNGAWGSVCDDGWSSTNAMVVCRQFGFVNAHPVDARHPDNFGPAGGDATSNGTGGVPIWADDVQCSGREQSYGNFDINVNLSIAFLSAPYHPPRHAVCRNRSTFTWWADAYG